MKTKPILKTKVKDFLNLRMDLINFMWALNKENILSPDDLEKLNKCFKDGKHQTVDLVKFFKILNDIDYDVEIYFSEKK